METQPIKPPESFEHDGASLAFRLVPGRAPAVVYITGFNSSMEGRKAERVETFCRARGFASLRFDHRGHGASEGVLADGDLGLWYRDARALLTAKFRGHVVLVGASMGAWLMLLLARGFVLEDGPLQAVGMLGIGAAVDIEARRVRESLSEAQRDELDRDGLTWRPSRYGDGPYPLTARMLEAWERYRVLDPRWHPRCPMRLLHGLRDPDAPWQYSLDIVRALPGEATRLTLIPDGDHRLSCPQDLDCIERALDALLPGVTGRNALA